MTLFRAGYVSIIGKTNVGKSTLLNYLLEQKLSIVSRKPQTTRSSLLGIKTHKDYQIIYVDTPGLQKDIKTTLNQYMNKETYNTMKYVDVVLFVVEALNWNELDENILPCLKKFNKKIILLINKTDKVVNKEKLLEFIHNIHKKINPSEVMPISAKNGRGLDKLESFIYQTLPNREAIYPSSSVTDRNERYFAAEFLREKLISRLGEELPYHLAITIDDFKEINNSYHIHASIWVERIGQKAIVIGKQGKVLKDAGIEARKSLEQLYNKKVNLKTWVKVKNKWTKSEQILKQLGYNN